MIIQQIYRRKTSERLTFIFLKHILLIKLEEWKISKSLQSDSKLTFYIQIQSSILEEKNMFRRISHSWKSFENNLRFE